MVYGLQSDSDIFKDSIICHCHYIFHRDCRGKGSPGHQEGERESPVRRDSHASAGFAADGCRLLSAVFIRCEASDRNVVSEYVRN